MRVKWTLTATGRAPADEVWRRYIEPSAWPSWSPQIRRVDPVDRLRVGSRGIVHTIFGVGVPFEVTALDDLSRSWSWRAQLPLGFTLRLTHVVSDAPAQQSAAGTRTTLTIEGFPLVVLPYLPLAQFALSRLVRD
jgi:hypothetical protein